jgi:NADH-quinone oxidoreductase subunit I
MATRVVTVDRNTKPASTRSCTGSGSPSRTCCRRGSAARAATVQFPEQKRKTSTRYRGIHILTQRMDGTPKCVACYMCATVCPAECIYIEAGERPEKDIEKYPTRFEIDLLRCVYCGFCVDACPEEAIVMSRENDLVGTSRAELIIDRDRLMDRGKLGEYGAGYAPDQHDVRRPVRDGGARASQEGTQHRSRDARALVGRAGVKRIGRKRHIR